MYRMDEYVRKMKEQLSKCDNKLLQNKASRSTEDSSLRQASNSKIEKQSSSCPDIFESRSKTTDAVEKEFEKVDTDQDGTISADDLRTLLESEVIHDHLCPNALISLFHKLERMSNDENEKLDKEQFMDIIGVNAAKVEADTAEHPMPNSELSDDVDTEHYDFCSVLQFFESKAAEARLRRNREEDLCCEERRTRRNTFSHNRASTAANAAAAVNFIPPPAPPREIPAHRRVKPH